MPFDARNLEPQLIEGDIFKIIVPLDENYSFDSTIGKPKNPNRKDSTPDEIKVLGFIKLNEKATQKEIAIHIGKSERTVHGIMANLQERKLLERKNGKRNGYWEVK